MDCIIIEDDRIARRGLALHVGQYPFLNLKAEFESAAEAREWLKGRQIDLVFLDIELPEETGIEFASELREDAMVIFTTAFSDYAVDSYALDAVDYLLKPFTTERFKQAIGKAVKRKQTLDILGQAHTGKESLEEEDSIVIRADRKNIPVRPSEIVYIEGIKDYVRIHTENDRIITRSTIKGLLSLLPDSKFGRIHKSYIINREKISSFDSTNVDMKVNDSVVTLPIGEKYRDDFLSYWKN